MIWYKRVYLLIATMFGVVGITLATSFYLLYSTSLKQQRARLIESAQSERFLIEEIFKHEEEFAHYTQEVSKHGSPAKALLKQLRRSHEHFKGFGETGEYTLAKKSGDQIVFLLKHRHDDREIPKPVPFDSKLAEPMRRALLKNAGTIMGLDYRGENVLAAYEWIAPAEMGIVAKIDLKEIRSPFIRAALWSLFVALSLSLLGAFIFLRLTRPMIQSLKKSEEQTALAMEGSRDGFWDQPDLNRDEQWWSSRFFEMIGYSKLQIRPSYSALTNLLHFEDLAKYEQALHAHFSRQVPFHIECRLCHKERYFHWFRVRGQAVFDSAQKPLRMSGSIQDIHKQKVAENDLKDSEEKYRALFGQAHTPIVLIELPKLSFTEFNSAAHESLGYTRQEFQKLSLKNILNSEKEEDFKPFLSPENPSKKGTSETTLQSKNGDLRNVLVSTNQIHIHGKIFILTTWIDLTEKIRVEAEQRKITEQLQHTQKLESLGILAGGIAHDFNNLLVGILGNASMALTEMSDQSPQRGTVENIRVASQKLADLTKQLLAYSGKGKFVVKPLNLNQLIQEMGSLLELSISKKAVIKYNYDKDLPLMEGDPSQIQQIIMNLLINAAEAMEGRDGLITLTTKNMFCDRAYLATLSYSENMTPGHYVYLEVADNGSGIDPKVLDNIFDPFFSTKFSGRGLGLSAVQGIVRGHKGNIKIYSEIGEGTTFKILFPVSTRKKEIVSSPKEKSSSWKGTGTVLVVDDEEQVRKFVKRLLEKIGFQVLLANDGQEALDIFREHAEEIQLVFLDMTMPRLSGDECFRELRRIKSDVLVILSSGYNEQDATSRFAGKGLAGFIQKPFDVDQLIQKIQEILK